MRFAGLQQLFSERNLRPLAVGASLMLFQQITGQPSVLYYAANIFKAAGFASDADATKVSAVLGLFKLLATGESNGLPECRLGLRVRDRSAGKARVRVRARFHSSADFDILTNGMRLAEPKTPAFCAASAPCNAQSRHCITQAVCAPRPQAWRW